MKFFFAFVISIFCFSAIGQSPVFPRYNQVYRMATHNSYWVKRAATKEPFASGTQERLLDQLLFDHARALEIDIHKIPGKRGQWAIYHTGRMKNVLFATLPDFLKQMQQFQYSLPQHEVVTVVLELKEILKHNFDATHTPADLDSLLETYLGESLFRPADLMKRCPGARNLCDCVKSSSETWPTIEELRGKVIFLVLGNFHWITIGHGGEGWAVYGASKNPTAFPMSTDFTRFNKGVTSEKIDAKVLSRAYGASVFRQVENVTDETNMKEARAFISTGGIVRGHDSYNIEEQRNRIKAGFHMLQTDYPRVYYRDAGYAQPFRPIDSSRFNEPSVFIEPGNRVFVSTDTETFWSVKTNELVSDWETLPSTTITSPASQYPNQMRTYGRGCLRAESDEKNSVTVCRKVYPGQNAYISVTVFENGRNTKEVFVTDERSVGKAGDYIRLVVNRNGSINVNSVQAYSSSEMEMDSSGKRSPKWNLLFDKQFSSTFTKQGISASDGDVLFTGTKRNGLCVSASDLTKETR